MQVVFFFEYLRVLSSDFTLFIVAPIFGDLIDKEQRQNLDALVEKHLFFFKVRLHRLTNLDAPQCRLVHVARGFACLQLDAVGETDRIGMGIDIHDDEALVLVQLIRNGEEVIVFTKLAHHALDAIVLLYLQLDSCDRRFAGGNLDGLQIEVGIGAAQALDGNAAHRNFLHQLLVVRVQRIEAVDFVVRGSVGGGIAQGAERVERSPSTAEIAISQLDGYQFENGWSEILGKKEMELWAEGLTNQLMGSFEMKIKKY